MARASFAGYSYQLNDLGVIEFGSAVLTFEATGDDLSFRYTIVSDEGLLSPIDFNADSYDRAYVTEGDLTLSLLDPELLFYIGTYFWDGAAGTGSAQIFDVTTSPISGYVFDFDGDPLPDLLDPETAAAWYGSIFGYQLIDSGRLAMGETVQFAALDHAEVRLGDTIIGTGDDDILNGGGGSDLLRGRGGSDFLFGRGGMDKLLGNGGGDHLYGGSGSDVLRGGRGSDWLTGGPGNDKLWGGPGADLFQFDAGLNNGRDRIKDFTPGADRIMIDNLDGFSNLTITEVDRGLRVAFHDTVILLVRIEPGEISADDFLFV